MSDPGRFAVILAAGVLLAGSGTGWADTIQITLVGNSGKIYQSADAGATWNPLSSGTTEDLYGVYFVDADRGWAVGGDGGILRTTNGGGSWVAQASGTGFPLLDLVFLDANTGWAVGAYTILHTTNGGSTWNAQSMPNTTYLKGVDFVDANHGWAVGSDNTILHTSDGGANWSEQPNPLSAYFVNEVDFVDQNRGWVVADFGQVAATTDGGNTWTLQSSGTPYHLDTVRFVDANTGWAGGNITGIRHTTNGGATWSAQLDTVFFDYTGIDFIDANTGWISGTASRVFSTANAGTNWNVALVGFPPPGNPVPNWLDVAADPIPSPSANIPAGANVGGSMNGGTSEAGGVAATFREVTDPGTLTAEYSQMTNAQFNSQWGGTAGLDQAAFAISSSRTQLWEVEFSGEFEQMITLKFAYDESLLSPFYRANENLLGISHYGKYGPGGSRRWKLLGPGTPGYSIDTLNNILTVGVDHLSPFVLAAAPVPEPSAGLLVALGMALIGAWRVRSGSRLRI